MARQDTVYFFLKVLPSEILFQGEKYSCRHCPGTNHTVNVVYLEIQCPLCMTEVSLWDSPQLLDPLEKGMANHFIILALRTP